MFLFIYILIGLCLGPSLFKVFVPEMIFSVGAFALPISALPVVVQILKDLRIYETRMGHTIVAAATICDVLAWLIFTFMLPVEDRSRWVSSHLPVLFFFVGLSLSALAARREWIFKSAMEILFCAIALKLGLIDERLFTSLTVMAVASSLMAAPLVKFAKRF